MATRSGSTRRQVLCWGAGSLLAGSMLSSSVLAASGISVPSSAMMLKRVLYRSLRDGKAITVTRSWRVRFVAQARGYAVTGEQVSVSVEAPPALAPLATLEEGRSTAEMFPILLSPEGTIMAVGPATSAQSMKAAIDKADAIIANRNATAQDMADYRRFVGELQKAGGSMLDQMPGDLFFPSTEPLREVRRVPLGDGLEGEFELGWEASVQPGTKWLSEARREVITRIGDSERISWEAWSLSPP